jgi:hypothetical protein
MMSITSSAVSSLHDSDYAIQHLQNSLNWADKTYKYVSQFIKLILFSYLRWNLPSGLFPTGLPY